ncbi:apolipoprotein N-acyltransferase [Pendulispora brunnea]|uniref:Apolipoprotein N-acyltransferase n=1 Tax=Pendulispora brunnea TaxID=2905690 RepID=A0ABZ2K6Z3_9BACT
MARRRRLILFSLACLSGAFFACASPPFDLVSALWFGMAAFAYSLQECAEAAVPFSWFRGGLLGLGFGIGANVVALRFVPGVITRFTPLPYSVGIVALVLLAASQALRWVVAAWAWNALTRRHERWRVPRPVAFAVAVYIGTWVPVIFPWNPAGGATLHPELVQLADTIGERGVSALMALSAGFLAVAVRQRQLRTAWAALALPALMYLHGRVRMGEIDALRARAKTATVALVQPSVEATERWDRTRARHILTLLTELTQRAERDGAELTIWHESAYPYEMAHASRRAPMASWTMLQPGVHGPVLTGLVLRDGGPPLAAADFQRSETERFNSAIVAHGDGTLSQPYDKLHLLWFGETVPLADAIPWIRRTFARGLGLTPGTSQVVLDVGKVRATVLICFEDTLPAAGREAMALAPNLLVNVTNDAWFTAGEAESTESELHLRMAVMRSIEGRRDMVRAVNFGPTSWVDAAGRVRGRYASITPGVLLATPALLETPATLYTRFGDLPFALVLVAGTAAFAWAAARRPR